MSKSFRSRVGSVMRRSSAVIALSRSNTPGPVESDSVSVKSQKQQDTLAPVQPQVSPPGVPSPVAESPAREAQATESEQTRPSIAEVTSTAIDKPAEPPKTPATIPSSITTIPSSSGAEGVGAFTDQPVGKEEDKKSVVPQGPQGDVAAIGQAPSPLTDEGLSPEQPDRVVKAPTPRVVATPFLPAIERSISNTEVFPSQGPEVLDAKDEESAGSSDGRLEPRSTYAPIDPWAAPEPGIADQPANGQSNGSAQYHSITKMPSVGAFGMPEADPFSDSQVTAVTSKERIEMPMPAVLPSNVQETESEDRGFMSIPLPAPQDVMNARPIARAYSLTGGSGPAVSDTDERRPLLLSRPESPKHASYLHTTDSEVPALIRVGRTSASVSNPLLHNLGWIEYVLPDASTYYVHPSLRVTTDVDLRNAKKLEAVTSYFDHQKSGAPVGLELWLRDLSTTRKGPVAKSFLVDHRKRCVLIDSTPKEGRAGKSKHQEEDRLDMEYRYWCYIESHPIHTTLPSSARAEAIDALSWAYADRLLPGHQRVPPPFTQEECQQLMGLLQSLNSDAQAESSVHSRVVARILLRAAHWRQTHSRPWKPLPLDAVYTRQPTPRTTISRRISNLFISCLCLGIPYFFMERVQLLRADEESGLQAPGPKLIIWACTCLAAVIVLSTSVTFLGLPGLDSYARIAGFLGIFLSAASLTSSVMVLFRLKSEASRASTNISGEGFVIPPRRGFVLSLPLVFLAYSLISFLAGVSLYSFRGVTPTNPSVITHPFNDLTKWTVAGAVGGFVCVLVASAWISRR